MAASDHIIRNPSLSEQVADRITESIVSGEFGPDEHLAEAKLASRYGVSRGPVREALQLLATQGLIELRGTKGAYVRTITADELERMVVLRSTLEGLAARIVAATGTEPQLAELEQTAKAMQQARDEGRMSEFRGLHAKFHNALCEFAGYPVVSSWWEVMRNLTRVFHGDGLLEDANETAINALADVEVLRKRDPDLAERHLRARVLREGYRGLGRDIPDALKDYLKD